MKQYPRTIILIAILQISFLALQSQTNKEIWKGTAKQDATNYTYTVKIDKIIRDSIFGTTTSSSNNFYSETKFKGIARGNTYTLIETQLIKTNYKGAGSVCLMKLELKKNNDKLKGNFTSSNKDIKDCGSGTISLELIKEEIKTSVNTKDSIKVQTKEIENRPSTITLSKSEELAKTTIIATPTKINAQRKIEQRDIDLLNTFRFKEDSAMIKIFDNGVIDGDVITLIVNGTIVFDKIKLTASPLSYALKSTTTNQFQIEFYAETLGEIPPNTGLITISSASRTSEILFSSDLKKSAAIKVLLSNTH